MSGQFMPYGLITDEGLHAFYVSARVTFDPMGNLVDPKEEHTVALFQHLFNRYIFTGTGFTVIPQCSPERFTQKACDLVIKSLTGQHAWQFLCFAEAKRANNTTGSRLTALEEQAKGYCRPCLGATGLPTVYACTMVGTYIRCWRVVMGSSDVQMLPFWGQADVGELSEYRDIGLEENKSLLYWTFNSMKNVPISHLGLNQTYDQVGQSGP